MGLEDDMKSLFEALKRNRGRGMTHLYVPAAAKHLFEPLAEAERLVVVPVPPVIPSKETDDPALIAHARALKEGPTARPQWEAGPWHPLDVPGGVKKP